MALKSENIILHLYPKHFIFSGLQYLSILGIHLFKHTGKLFSSSALQELDWVADGLE